MKKIQIDPGKPSVVLKPKEPFYLDEIKISFKIVELSFLSPAIDYSFQLDFVNNGYNYQETIYLRHPYFYLDWELNPLTLIEFDIEKVKFNQFKILSNKSNPKSVRLEVDFYRK